MSGHTDVTTQLNELMSEFDQEEERLEKLKKFIAECPEDKLEDLLKAVNPYGPVIPKKTGKEEMVSFSHTNMRMEYAKRFARTADVAFNFRMLREWKVPEEVPPVDIEDYLANPSILDTPVHIKDPRLQEKWAEMRATMPERVTIWNYLKSIYGFDPDRHVASALATNKKDPSRGIPPATKAVMQSVTAPKNAVRASVKRQDWEVKPDELAQGDAAAAEVAALGEVDKAAFTLIPPADMFAKLDRYTAEHYEELQNATHRVYGVRPDIDYCVVVYDLHKTKEDAQKFKDRHMDRVIAPITQIQKNRWAILGDYRENREKVDFLNRHTEVLKEMLDQRERDSHVATDIMKKRIKTKKAENIAEAGPDDAAFKRYLKSNKPQIASLGGEHVTQGDESEDECPEDAVEVNVFTVGEGGREMKVHKIYNPVEAPVGSGGERKTHEELVAGAVGATVASL
jgi:hypothetical protein